MLKRIANSTMVIAAACGVVLLLAVQNTIGNALSAFFVEKLGSLIGVPASSVTGLIAGAIVPVIVGIVIFYVGFYFCKKNTTEKPEIFLNPDMKINDAIDYIVNDSIANLKCVPPPKIVEFGFPNGSQVHYGVEHDNARIQINEKLISGDLTASGRRQLTCDMPIQFERHRRPIPKQYWDSYQIDFHSCLYYTEQHPQTCKLRDKPDLGNWTGLMLSKQQVRQLWPPQSLFRRLWKRITRQPRISHAKTTIYDR